MTSFFSVKDIIVEKCTHNFFHLINNEALNSIIISLSVNGIRSMHNIIMYVSKLE